MRKLKEVVTKTWVFVAGVVLIVSSSRVISAIPAGGVTVVSTLSDGSACSVRLTGENKEAVAYIFFPNGYDGSLEYNPATDKALG